MLQVGAVDTAQVEDVARAVIAILETGAEQETLRVALSTLATMTKIENITISENVFTHNQE